MITGEQKAHWWSGNRSILLYGNCWTL